MTHGFQVNFVENPFRSLEIGTLELKEKSVQNMLMIPRVTKREREKESLLVENDNREKIGTTLI